MRKNPLIISLVIGILGIVAYFASVPTLNEEALVHLTVEAGDEKLLEDVYFNGYLYDFSSFQINSQQGVTTNAGLPYLKQLDAPEDSSLRVLQEKYPAFIDEILYNPYVSYYYFLNSDKFLVSSSFKRNEADYFIDHSTIYLSALNKETNETVTDEVKRQHFLEIDHLSVVGLYEEFPVVKILYTTSLSTVENAGEKSNLVLGEYNFETKNYTETSLLKETGSFYSYNSNPYYMKNNDIQIIEHYKGNFYEDENISEPSSPDYYVYDFTTGALTLLQHTERDYFIGNKNQLFALEKEGKEVVLRRYNQNEELESEVSLDVAIPLHLQTDYPITLAEVIDNRLFVVQSFVDEGPSQKPQPSPLQVFDLASGESLLVGKLTYDINAKTDAIEAAIDSIGQISEFD